MRRLIFWLAMVLLVGGVIGFLVAHNLVREYQSLGGAFERVLDQAAENAYHRYQSYRQWGAVAVGVSYVVMTGLAWLAVRDEERRAMLRCKSCEVDNLPGAKFCRGCGKSL